MENDFIKLINTRRSCRKYKTQQVDDQLLKEVLKAGTTRLRVTARSRLSSWPCRTANSAPH